MEKYIVKENEILIEFLKKIKIILIKIGIQY